MVPAELDEGVGGVVVPTVEVDELYQVKFCPFAVKGTVGANWHKVSLTVVGAVGNGFTTTKVVAGVETQPATVVVTEYDPAIKEVTLFIVGFWTEELNAFGPDQL